MRTTTDAPATLTLRHVHDKVRATYERVSHYRLIDVCPDTNVGLESVLTLASRVDEYGAVEYVVHRASQADDYASISGGHYTGSIADAIANIRARAGVVNANDDRADRAHNDCHTCPCTSVACAYRLGHPGPCTEG